MSSLHLLLIGCGKMGSALVRRWQSVYPDLHLTIVEPSALPDVISKKNVTHVATPQDLKIFDGNMVVLAVKPQIMGDVCAVLKDKIKASVPVLTIAAGKSISFYEGYFGTNSPVIRTIPNTPAAVGQGVTGMVANTNVNPTQKKLAEDLMASVGQVFWVQDEDKMHDFTAIASSGVAYVFYLMETLSKAAENTGLSKTEAEIIGRQTVIGASLLARDDSDTSAAQLRQNVTSPNGTTQAALAVLMAPDGLQKLMDQAIDAAVQRGKELSRN